MFLFIKKMVRLPCSVFYLYLTFLEKKGIGFVCSFCISEEMHPSHPVIFQTLPLSLFPSDNDQECCNSAILQSNPSVFVWNYNVDWRWKKTLRWDIYLSEKSSSPFILMEARKNIKHNFVAAGVIKGTYCFSFRRLST